MSVSMLPYHEQCHAREYTLSLRTILGIYAIIPVCFILQIIDKFVLNGSIMTVLPTSPNHFVLFQVLFGTPHIIASTLILACNKEYFVHYRKQIALMTACVAVIFGIGSLFISYRVFYIAVASWTVLHVIKQQYGIARGVCKLPAWSYNILLALSVMAGIAIYLAIFLRNQLSPEQAQELSQVASVFCFLFILFAFYAQRFVTTHFAKWFYWANVLLIISSFYFYSEKYYFFAILVPRLVHDLTAYMVYITHDLNKHQLDTDAVLYKKAKQYKIPVAAVLPLLSFGLAFVLQAYGDDLVQYITQVLFATEVKKAVTVGVVGYLALLHYYTEAFTWKQDSPYRRFLRFSK